MGVTVPFGATRFQRSATGVLTSRRTPPSAPAPSPSRRPTRLRLPCPDPLGQPPEVLADEWALVLIGAIMTVGGVALYILLLPGLFIPFFKRGTEFQIGALPSSGCSSASTAFGCLPEPVRSSFADASPAAGSNSTKAPHQAEITSLLAGSLSRRGGQPLSPKALQHAWVDDQVAKRLDGRHIGVSQ